MKKISKGKFIFSLLAFALLLAGVILSLSQDIDSLIIAYNSYPVLIPYYWIYVVFDSAFIISLVVGLIINIINKGNKSFVYLLLAGFLNSACNLSSGIYLASCIGPGILDLYFFIQIFLRVICLCIFGTAIVLQIIQKAKRLKTILSVCGFFAIFITLILNYYEGISMLLPVISIISSLLIAASLIFAILFTLCEDNSEVSRIFVNDVVNEPDIKPTKKVGYRGIRIIAWVLLAISTLSVVFAAGSHLISSASASFQTASSYINFLGYLPVPLFLLANFSVILKSGNNYKRLFILYGALFAAMFVLINFVVLHYIMGSMVTILKYDYFKAYTSANNMMNNSLSSVTSLNIFVDLLLCALTYFFLTYMPKSNLFQGKKIYIFRSFIIFPLLYVIGCTLLKLCASREMIVIPFFVYPLLATKPILTYLSFMIIMFIFAYRRRYFMKRGLTQEQYDEFLLSRRNSSQLSIIIAFVFSGVALIDLIILVIGKYSFSVASNLTDSYDAMVQFGIGSTFPLIFVVPFTIIYDYSKKYTNDLVDILVPIGGVALIAVVLLEGFFQVITHADFFAA